MASSQEWCQQPICARFEGTDLIRIRAPGRFEITFNKSDGFGSEIYDLQADPNELHDVSSLLPAVGILWTKIGRVGDDGSYYANYATDLELLESGGARVRASHSGKHNRYGDPSQPWNELGFEQTFTVYATGEVYVDYALVASTDVTLLSFDTIIESTGDWGADPSATAPNEAQCIGEFGLAPPYQSTASSFALVSSNGSHYYADVLMAPYLGVHDHSYWNEGYLNYDFRCGLFLADLYSTAPAGTTHIPIFMRVARDMNDAATALKHADAYRNPDAAFSVLQGIKITTDPGDRDGDGFNEDEGAYVLQRETGHDVEFVLHGDRPRENPAFKILDWNGASPQSILVNGVPWQVGTQFHASTSGSELLLQLVGERTTDSDVKLVPEPGELLSLGSGLALLSWIHSCRNRSRRRSR